MCYSPNNLNRSSNSCFAISKFFGPVMEYLLLLDDRDFSGASEKEFGISELVEFFSL